MMMMMMRKTIMMIMMNDDDDDAYDHHDDYQLLKGHQFWGRRGLHAYIIFVIFAPRTRFLVTFCSSQKCVNHNKWILHQNSVNHYKTAYIVYLPCAAKFGTRRNLSLIHKLDHKLTPLHK